MEQRVVTFIEALRHAGVRVSVAESVEAVQAIAAAGVAQRDWFRVALRATLIKEVRDHATFDELFPQYFGGVPPTLQRPGDQLTPEERERLEALLQQLLDQMSPAQLAQLFAAMMRGDAPGDAQIRELLEQGTSLGQLRGSMPGSWAARRALRELEVERLEALLQQLLERLREAGVGEEALQQIADDARANRDALQQQIADEAAAMARRRALEDARRRTPSVDEWLDQPLESLSALDPRDLRQIVARLAAQLRTRAALRQRRAPRGQLDTRRTIRTNLRYGAVPVIVQHRQRQRKPRLTIICDVSGSMRPVAAFMLQLVYALQDQISRTRPFVYYRTIADVTSDFAGLRAEAAVEIAPTRVRGGPYQTSLGSCLATFVRDHLGTVDRRTTVIFLGDGDDHLGPPNPRDFAEIRRRARTVLWLNPEHPSRWGHEDNHMDVYGPLCHAVHHVANVRQLATAVERLFD
jgi:uncharacterized protein with von Willebrand factor type A (vWA) domain